MGFRDWFKGHEAPSSDPSKADPDQAMVTAQEGLAATDTYVDEDGRRHKLTPERKAEMMANLERISAAGAQGLVPGVMPPPVVPVGPDAPGDPVGQLERLASLHASGALTDEEFAAQKARIAEGS